MIATKDVNPQVINLVPSANVFALGQFSHRFFKTLRCYIEEKIVGNNVSYQKGFSFLKLYSFRIVICNLF